MSDRFDRLTRAMAEPTSRRGALKILGAAAAAAAGAAVLRPLRASAISCPAGVASCGQGCCPKGGSCSDPASSCCCPKGTAPCGQSCCKSGIACIDRSRGLCGCPAGTTPCGSGTNLTCCPAGQACGSGCPLASSLATATACVSGTTSGCASSICAGQGNQCNSTADLSCPGNRNCICVATTEGCQACIVGYVADGLCGASCTASSQCPSGSVCTNNAGGPIDPSLGCCLVTNNFCSPLCPTGQ